MRRSLPPAAVLLLALAGCDDPIPPPLWNDVAGTYQGAVQAIRDPGFRYSGMITLEIAQTDSVLSGSYELQAIFTLEGVEVDFVGGGTLAGTIAQGVNPVIGLELTDSKDCFLAGTMTLAGNHMTNGKLMNLRGRMTYYDANCGRVGFFHHMSLTRVTEAS